MGYPPTFSVNANPDNSKITITLFGFEFRLKAYEFEGTTVHEASRTL